MITTKQRLGWATEAIDNLSDYWPLTLRQVFYQLVSRLSIPNTQNQYKSLSAALSKARKDGQDWNGQREAARLLLEGKMRKRALWVLALMLLVVSCTTPEVLAPPPTPTPKTCDGWALRLLRVEEEELGEGWKSVTGYVAIENVNADTTSLFGYDLEGIFSSVIVSTSEGYTYPIDDYSLPWSSVAVWVPPGFRYRTIPLPFFIGDNQQEFGISFRVASGRSGYKANTSCGLLDFGRPASNLLFPTELPSSEFLSLGTPIEMAEGVMNFTSARTTGEDLTFHYTFTNASKGYGAYLDVYSVIIGSDGAVLWTEYPFRISAGPGQTVDGSVTFPKLSAQNSKLILWKDNQYWVINLD